MIQANDSVTHISNEAAEAAATHHYKTVEQVLRSLPDDATPAQQDSAVQANMPQREIHYSNRPDTLHLPGLEVKNNGESIVCNPHYPGESFFDADSMYQQGAGRMMEGMTADPIPFQLRNADAVTGVLLISFILSVFVLARGHRFIVSELREFFRNRERSNAFSVETRRDAHSQVFMLLQTVLILGMLFFDYTQDYIPDAFYENSPYLLLGINFGIIGAFVAAKLLVMQFVNWVFFPMPKVRLFMRGYILLLSGLGLALLPLCLLVVYFDLSATYVWLNFHVVVVGYILLLLYKCYTIFFHTNYGFLHLIVYFCSVELTPAFVLVQALLITNKSLIINI